jgi:hypothetical protein
VRYETIGIFPTFNESNARPGLREITRNLFCVFLRES